MRRRIATAETQREVTPAPARATVEDKKRQVSALAPLALPVFRALWIASVASNIGTWMQNVGAAWLMTSLTTSPVLVALLQTATSLPIFLVGLPAGALADIVDRRKLLVITQAWMLAAAAVLSVLTVAGWMSAWTLLALTFLLGLGGALNAPAWQAVVPELVGRRHLPAAVALNSAGFNLARAVGPALGGVVVAVAGPGAVFLLNALSFLGVVVVIYRWKRPEAASLAPSEDIFGAIAAGARYARHAPALQAVLIRAGVFIVAASALWALLPVVARQDLKLDASGYGVLLGSIGLGAVAGAAILPRLRQAMHLDQMMAIAIVVFAAATFALGHARNLLLLDVAMFAGGIAWMAVMSSLNVSAQTSSPGWVLARAMGVYLLVFQGGMAAGSFGWGALANRLGNSVSLLVAAIVLGVGLIAAWKWRLHSIRDLDLTPSMYWPEPRMAINPNPEDGPVLVTVEYRVADENADAFTRAMQSVRTARRRDGAIRWELFRDSAEPDRYVETFVVDSWAEHLRQHARTTVADQAIQSDALAFQKEGVPTVVSHLIAARPSADEESGQ